MALEETGFCWECGLPIKAGLFCPQPKKCEAKYQRKQLHKKKILFGRRANYGAVGSTH